MQYNCTATGEHLAQLSSLERLNFIIIHHLKTSTSVLEVILKCPNGSINKTSARSTHDPVSSSQGYNSNIVVGCGVASCDAGIIFLG